MSFIPNNINQNVITYNDAKLGYLLNLNCFVAKFNTKYKNFENETANLGDTINLELPNRGLANAGLVASYNGVQQTFQPLICDQAANSANAFTAQQFIFNDEQYMEKFGEARAIELSQYIEANVAKNANSSVPVMTVDSNGQSIPTGALHTESGPYRYFGDGFTPINSVQQLARMAALFRDYGAAMGPLDVYFDNIAQVDVVGTMLNQFVPDRNEKYSNSWDLGTYKASNLNFYISNNLPIQIAGTCGNNQDPLVLVSTNDPTGANITQLTFSGVTQTAGAFNPGDLLQFNASNNLVYLKWNGHTPSQNLVQVRVISLASSGGGQATVNIYPPLQSTVGLTQNLSTNLVAGMTATAVPSHRCGLVVGGKAAYLAMPALPPTTPFPSHTSVDKETMVSIRNYFGTDLGRNRQGFVTDCIWASTVVPNYCMRLIFPLS